MEQLRLFQRSAEMRQVGASLDIIWSKAFTRDRRFNTPLVAERHHRPTRNIGGRRQPVGQMFQRGMGGKLNGPLSCDGAANAEDAPAIAQWLDELVDDSFVPFRVSDDQKNSGTDSCKLVQPRNQWRGDQTIFVGKYPLRVWRAAVTVRFPKDRSLGINLEPEAFPERRFEDGIPIEGDYLDNSSGMHQAREGVMRRRWHY